MIAIRREGLCLGVAVVLGYSRDRIAKTPHPALAKGVEYLHRQPSGNWRNGAEKRNERDQEKETKPKLWVAIGDDSWSIELHATVSALEVPNSGGIRAEAKTGLHGESRTSREKSRYKKGLDGLAENEWKDHPQASPAANEQAKQANNPSAIHRFKASSDCTRDTMKLSVFTALSALFLAAAATPARSRVLVCNMPSGCTNLGGCNFCCDNTPSGCHLHGPPYETCNGNMGIVVHCEPH
ncbi:uncharacterized protein CIMG_10500 [Coccidioides immitis RS]|uniref:Uncharacterized protein n=1 Tax=Coccidioides immitis (strain RS) TaxID=246410 RepID=A0A0D8JST7_COCIM|nr:uncharacterized protein CIMG_10500 [Coccidioides immitis RS]KJF60352.1 hypothetical protein CIMG_10500 [Coccidioides immitis RS]